MSDNRPENAGGSQSPKDRAAQVKDKAKALAGSAGEKLKTLASSPDLRDVRPLTWVGLALAAVYFIGLFIDTINVRWWIMLPLGVSSLLVLWKQWKSTPEERPLELKLTFFGMTAMLGFLFIRDAWLSSSLADIYEKAKESGETIREFEKLIGR